MVCLHVGSSGTSPATAPDAPSDTIGVLFFGYAMFAAVDWLYSKLPVRFPDLRICLSEGGIGWVAGLLDRLEHVRRYDSMYGTWNDVELSPADTFRRNFWVCAIDDPSAFLQRDVIGVENILVESDYPHCDSTWPGTQDDVARAARRALRRRDRAGHVGATRASCSATRCPKPCSSTRMPSDGADAETESSGPRPGRSRPGRGRRRRRRTVRHFGGVPYAQAERFGAAAPAGAVERAARRHPPGAAPPQRTEGLELVPGMAPDTHGGGLPHRRGLDTARVPDGGAADRCSCGSRAAASASAEPRLPTYDGRHLAADGDLVVVGLNYRLGALGFLAADGVPSNLGLRDLLAAIDWVRANAAAFGGDPDRITLMGESAGAGAITASAHPARICRLPAPSCSAARPR